MPHGFQLDPHVVLGVSAGASLEEIRDAYYQKSKKYHPDVGGDEWIFRLVARAYEILKAAASDRIATMPLTREDGHAWPANGDGYSFGDADSHGHGDVPAVDPARIVDVDVIGIRFEAEVRANPEDPGSQDQSLSGCLNIAWPEPSQTDRILEIPDAAAILRNLIQIFETMRKVTSVTSARARIEDGRFVGWLGYANGNRAYAASSVLRDALKSNGLGVNYCIHDLTIPSDRS